ncbi:MAG: DUF3581 family protein, partial [Gammaproteobacteria bacterium]|nr:DUF3581 family protein [Gammaproteobacteria bacterium]
MFVSDYYSEDPQGIRFSRQQGSEFAKQIAGDYNPLHNPDEKLFCIPGDLLFALVLAKYGVSQRMHITFSGMVDDRQRLHFLQQEPGRLALQDSEGKQYLELIHSGTVNHEPQLLERLIRNYVSFSGHTFPDVLIPLMERHDVIINPARPIVIYQSMELALDSVDIAAPDLEFDGAQLDVNGKKGEVRLDFNLKLEDQIVGSGTKYMALRGLRPYDPGIAAGIVQSYM